MASDMLAKIKGTIAHAGGRAFFCACWLQQRSKQMSKKFEIPEAISRDRIEDERYVGYVPI